MREYCIIYYPMWSQFSRLSTIVRANSIEQAEIRFWASRESDWIKEEHNHYCPDCYEYDDDDNLIIKIERKDLNLRTSIN